MVIFQDCQNNESLQVNYVTFALREPSDKSKGGTLLKFEFWVMSMNVDETW